MKNIIFSHKEAQKEGEHLLGRIAQGDNITDEERFSAIKNILAFSGHDWSADPELWLIYKIALNDASDEAGD